MVPELECSGRVSSKSRGKGEQPLGKAPFRTGLTPCISPLKSNRNGFSVSFLATTKVSRLPLWPLLLLFSCSVVSGCLWPQHARLPCPSLSSGVCWNSWPLSRWCHPNISSSVVPFSSCLQSFSASHLAKGAHTNQFSPVLWPPVVLSLRFTTTKGYISFAEPWCT